MTTPAEKRFDDMVIEIVDPYEHEPTDTDGFNDTQLNVLLRTPGAYLDDAMRNIGALAAPGAVVAASRRVTEDDDLDDVNDNDLEDVTDVETKDVEDDVDDSNVSDDSDDDDDERKRSYAVTAGTVELQSDMPKDLKDYWLRGEGAVKIRWGTEGSFRRCVKEMKDHVDYAPEGLCANLYHEATGHWPGEKRRK